jgi:glycerol-3-phosphate acyltransferase PlsY
MDGTLAAYVASAVVGYLFGSLSGARIVGRLRGAGDLSDTKVVLDGTGASVVTHGVSPSALQARQGGRSGVPAGIIDIGKAFVPALIVRLIWPEGPEYVLVAAGALVGHVYPVYHRFVGGYGISPLLGGLFVIDWRAPLVAIAVFAVFGLIVGSVFLGIETWPIGLVLYFAIWGDEWTVGYAALANALYWWRSRHEAAGAFRSFRRDRRPWRERVADFKKYPDYEVPGAS